METKKTITTTTTMTRRTCKGPAEAKTTTSHPWRFMAALALFVFFLLPPGMGADFSGGWYPVATVRTDGPILDLPPISEAPVYDLEAVDIYAELFPEDYEAEVITVAYINSNGSDPVILRCEGNFKWLKISSDQPNISFDYRKPYFWFDNISSATRRLRFEYRVRHDGNATAGAIISTNRLHLPCSAYWYPRDVASDPHQVVLNLVTPPTYAVYCSQSGTLTRDIMNNLKRLRTFVIQAAIAEGMALSNSQ